MSVSDWVMVFAVIAAPVLAVQASESLGRRRAARDRRLLIFQTLMATRTQRLSAAHVNALNTIDVEFYGKRKFVGVIRAWHEYLDTSTP